MGGRPLVRIIATHYHPDHLGNAAWLSERFGCPVTMTMTEFLTAHAVLDERAAHGPRDICELFRAHGMSAEDVAALAARGNHYRHRRAERTADRCGDCCRATAINAGGDAWQVIAGYGHSPEHASLFGAARGVLVSGDMLLPKISTNVSVWPERSGRRTRWAVSWTR